MKWGSSSILGSAISVGGELKVKVGHMSECGNKDCERFMLPLKKYYTAGGSGEKERQGNIEKDE